MTSFEEVDVDNNGSIDKTEWDALALEDRRRRLDDEDAQGMHKDVWHGSA